MRPCKACGAALPNNCEVCPECGAELPLRFAPGPPPETGPGISGGPEERAELLGLLVPPAIVAVVCGVGAVSLWGPWGILAGLLAGLTTFFVLAVLHVL